MIRWLKRKIEQWEGKYPVGVSRSPQWPKTEKEFKAAGNDSCIVCSTKEDVQIHHVITFCRCPEKELDWSNLCALCREHHFDTGHLRSWKSYNPTVIEDAQKWAEKIKNRP